jgi:hypothetical protein
MGPRRTATLLMFAASQACAQPSPAIVAAPPVAPPPIAAPPVTVMNGKPIFAAPPLQWDATMSTYRRALHQTATDFSNLTGGVVFGMSPKQVNALLPEPFPAMSWNALALANEFPGEARYLTVPIAHAGPLRMDLAACAGAASYVVFLFSSQGLFRLSYRLIADKICSDTNPAAQALFARYVPIETNVALSVRYRRGRTEVVDITDPTAGYLTPIRWGQGGN